MAPLLFYAFKGTRQKFCISQTKRYLFSHSKLTTEGTCSHEGLHYLFNPPHWIDLLIDILYLGIKIMYTKMSLQYGATGSTKVLHFFALYSI